MNSPQTLDQGKVFERLPLTYAQKEALYKRIISKKDVVPAVAASEDTE
jgi:hypothetical protein